MNEDNLKGNLQQAKGEMQEGAGKMTNDTSETMKGKANQAAGKVKEAFGDAKEDLTGDKRRRPNRVPAACNACRFFYVSRTASPCHAFRISYNKKCTVKRLHPWEGKCLSSIAIRRRPA